MTTDIQPKTKRTYSTISTIVASASRANLNSRRAVKDLLSKRQEWQLQAIDDVRVMGELAYGIGVLSSLVSRTTMFVATLPEETDAEPIRLVPSSDNDRLAVDTFERLGNQLLRTDIQFDLAFNLMSTGEAYLVCFGQRPGDEATDTPATPEHWEVRGISEVERSGKTVKVWSSLRDEKVTLDRKEDTFIRIWRADPFEHDKAWSNVRAILTSAEELLWWDSAAQAAAKNRMALAGLIGIPNNLEAKGEEDDPPGMTGSETFVYRMTKNAIQAIKNPSDAAAAVPFIFTYPYNEQGKAGIDVTEFERPQDDLLEKRTDRCLIRIEQGINLPVGVISGLGRTTHWGGGMVEESVFRDHIEPSVVLQCSALSRAFLQPILRASGVKDAERYFIWYDASNLIIHRDRAANALRAIELGGISWGAGRRELGFTERDKPTPQEAADILAWIRAVRGRDAQGVVANPTDPNQTPESPTTPPSEPEVGGRSPEGERNPTARGKGQDPIQAGILVAQVRVLCDEMIRRGLERAGNRLRNRANRNPAYKEAIFQVPPTSVAATLGPEAVAVLHPEDLFSDTFTDLNARICGILPASILALDTITPINSLAAHLRRICYEHLYDPPGPGPIVSTDLITDHLVACIETLSLDPDAA